MYLNFNNYVMKSYDLGRIQGGGYPTIQRRGVGRTPMIECNYST